MGSIAHIETLTAPFLPYGSDIFDLVFVEGSGGPSVTVIAGTYSNARFLKLSTDPVAVTLDYGFLGTSPADFSRVDYGAQELNLSTWRLDSQRDLTSAAQVSAAHLSDLNSGFSGSSVMAVWGTAGGDDWLVTSRPDTVGLAVFDWDGSTGFAPGSVTAGITETSYSDLASVTAFGKSWIIGPSAEDDVVSVHSLASDGSLTFHSRSGTANGVWIGAPVAQSVVEIDGQPFVLVAASQSSSLSVLRLLPDGTLVPVDHVIDDLATRFASATHVETAVVGGTAFAVVSGSDDGFTLFQIRPDGHLVHVFSQQDTAATTLENISALTIASDSEDLHIYAASAVEIGLWHFKTDIDSLGLFLSGAPVDDALVGAGKDDILLGGAGDDTLRGFAGDDIFADGPGADGLYGGAGADRFIFDHDGDTDTVFDFEPGLDSLDLSYFPLLYDVADLDFASTSTGARITFKGDQITLYSIDGTPLSRAQVFAISPFDLTRPVLTYGAGDLVPSEVTLLGSDHDDLLIGTSSDDYISGAGGDDVMIGAAGADAFFGGNGFDTVDYSTSTTGITFDLLTPALNTGDSAGDSFSSIEAITATLYDDALYGSHNADLLTGLAGDDVLFGRGGNDALRGGDGDDLLVGGFGADVLDGGSGTDTVDYSAAITGIEVDLSGGASSGGGAAGDQFIAIENIVGTSARDIISGSTGVNHLSGGGGDDFLSGGAGTDILDGGAGRDRAVYSMAKTGLTVDLGDPARNTGEAAGDSLVLIEDINGSRFGDQLTGDLNDNGLFGGGGNDTLNGLSGDDVLNGGFGDDRLIGGSGDDSLTGAFGADTFVFATYFGVDRILDFDAELDRIELAAALFASPPTSGQALLDSYGSITGSAALLDFGAAGSLTLDGITDLNALADTFLFV